MKTVGQKWTEENGFFDPNGTMQTVPMPNVEGCLKVPYRLHEIIDMALCAFASIKLMQDRVFEWAKAKGWCDREVPVPEQCALIHSEISEALEAWRNHEPVSWTDENGKPQGIGSEYADAVIRIMHYCSLQGIDLASELRRKMDYNDTRAYRHGGKQG